MSGVLLQVKDECLPINNLDIASDMNGSERIISCDHDALPITSSIKEHAGRKKYHILDVKNQLTS